MRSKSYHVRRAIYELSDEDLVKEAAALEAALLPPAQLADLPTLTDWEKNFLSSMQGVWCRQGEISWRQRRTLREILTKVAEQRARKAELDDVRKAVAAR